MREHTSADNRKIYFLIVTVPVADLRSEPIEGPAGPGRDNTRETQLLFGETLIYRDERQGWYSVEAREQKKLVNKDTLSGYPGWVKKEYVAFIDDLPITNFAVSKGGPAVTDPFSKAGGGPYLPAGTLLNLSGDSVEEFAGFYLPGGGVCWTQRDSIIARDASKSPGELRRRVVATAMSFIGTPYLWGGRSTLIPFYDDRTGMDCSGFTNLAYRVSGVDIPRDAHDQWAASRKVLPGELKPADLVFLSLEDRRDLVVHVMLLLDGERFIEAAETGLPVGIRTFREKFGKSLKDIVKNNSATGGRQLYYGSFIRDE